MQSFSCCNCSCVLLGLELKPTG
uniref:Uncharacterized protein n=1 Tax=Anguilla anguilla TaxID=7936 RepID=A0A0E9PLD8_ANGAN